MHVRVVVPPEPIVTPAEIAGDHAPDDAGVKALIAAATEEIDGPNGWVGRCFGPQTLEMVGSCWPDFRRLPYPPFIALVSVAYVDTAGIARSWSDGGPPFPTEAPPAVRGREGDVVVRWRAGYDGTTTEAMPARAKQAVILMTLGLLAAAEKNGGLRSFTVEGAFTRAFNSPEMMEKVRSDAVQRLLQGLRVYA